MFGLDDVMLADALFAGAGGAEFLGGAEMLGGSEFLDPSFWVERN